MSIDIPPNAKRHFNEAVADFQDKLVHRRAGSGYDQVIDHLRQAVREYPKFFEAWRLLGEVYLGTEQTLRGYLALKRAHYIKGDDPGVATLLGEASLILGRPELALKYLAMAQSQEETRLSVKKMTAIALAKDERWEEAIRNFGDALGDDPSDGDMRRECANVLWELGFHKEAASVLADYLDPFREFIEHQPAIVESGWIMPLDAVLDRLFAGARKRASAHEVVAHQEDYRAWYLLGNIFLDGEQWGAAVSCFRRSLRIHPDFYDALNNMGIALEEMGRSEEARQMYEAAIETDPEEAEAYWSMAELLEDLCPEDKDEITLNYLMFYLHDSLAAGFEEQEPELLARLETSPDISQQLILARVYLQRDEVAKAYKMLRGMESAGTGEALMQWLKGQVLFEMDRLKEAEEAFRKGLEDIDGNEPESRDESEDIEPQLRLSLAELLADTDRDSEAVKVLEESVDSLDADGLSLLAEFKLESNPKEAEEIWRKAVEIDAGHVESLIGLADLMVEAGKTEDAIIFLEKAFESDPEDEEVIDKLSELYPEIGAPELSLEMDESEEEETGIEESDEDNPLDDEDNSEGEEEEH
jgi:tetratricopeptide (TPR) repeat protein